MESKKPSYIKMGKTHKSFQNQCLLYFEGGLVSKLTVLHCKIAMKKVHSLWYDFKHKKCYCRKSYYRKILFTEFYFHNLNAQEKTFLNLVVYMICSEESRKIWI